MGTHEIRLINEDGDTSLVYLTSCASDEHARDTLARINAPYARFEIWRGLRKVAEGPRGALRQDA